MPWSAEANGLTKSDYPGDHLYTSRDRAVLRRTQMLKCPSSTMAHKHASFLNIDVAGACTDIRTSPCMCDTPPAWRALWQAGLCSLQSPRQPLPCPPWWRTPGQRTALLPCRHRTIIHSPRTSTTALPVIDIFGETRVQYLVVDCDISQHADRHRHCYTEEA